MQRKNLEKRISAIEGQLNDENAAIAQMVGVWLTVLKRFSEHYHIDAPELDDLIKKSWDKLGDK